MKSTLSVKPCVTIARTNIIKVISSRKERVYTSYTDVYALFKMKFLKSMQTVMQPLYKRDIREGKDHKYIWLNGKTSGRSLLSSCSPCYSAGRNTVTYYCCLRIGKGSF